MSENISKKTFLISVSIIALCFIFILIAGLLGYGYYVSRDKSTSNAPSLPFNRFTPTALPQILHTEGGTSNETLKTLEQSLVPENDPYELACRLHKLCNVPKIMETQPYRLGDTEKFWILDSDTMEHRQIQASLMYITDHTYFWAEEGVNINKDNMQALMDKFESSIYPTDRAFFGSEWTPGVDGDPHIFVIYANQLGRSIAGYYNSSDEYNPLVRKYSNAHETYVLSTTENLASPFTYTTLAHEFVHMIQFPADRNEVTWISEGFAEVGAFINGYSIGSADFLYIQKPDLQLTDWVENTSPDFSAHYGQSFLFLTYFLDRFGETATKALTSNPKNDLTSIDDTLASLNITDPLTNNPINADSFFMDWAVTNFLLDGSVSDGRYVYGNYPAAVRTSTTNSISNCPQPPLTFDVNQYGVDYIEIKCPGNHTLTFQGSTAARIFPTDMYSGQYAFWSNRGDESDMTLTRDFDFSTVSAPINLSYHAWFNIESTWDYLYLEISEDGQNWEIIKTPSGTGENPSGGAYGWGYTGQSNGWLEENIDLSKYAGKKITVRFEYVTDSGINEESFLLDDISVDAAGYSSDFESDDGGWRAEGFVRIQNVLPQTFGLALILTSDSSVTMIPLSADQAAEIPLSLKSGEKAYLVIAGTTRFTREHASYQIEIK